MDEFDDVIADETVVDDTLLGDDSGTVDDAGIWDDSWDTWDDGSGDDSGLIDDGIGDDNWLVDDGGGSGDSFVWDIDASLVIDDIAIPGGDILGRPIFEDKGEPDSTDTSSGGSTDDLAGPAICVLFAPDSGDTII